MRNRCAAFRGRHYTAAMLGILTGLAAVCLPAAFCSPAAVCSSAAAARPSDLTIVVNGARVVSDVTPIEEDGRVLVPGRAVFNALGAFVDYDAATRTVIAARPDVTVVLHAFSQRAVVNGRTVWLDVPTQIVSGRTLVPLRFVGESLGAGIDYRAAAGIVAIELAGAKPYASVAAPNAGPLAIRSLDIDTHGKTMLVDGDVIAVNLTGTPSALATFDVAGIATSVAMHEVSPGVYTGFYVVPAGRNVNDIRIYAHLREGAVRADRESDDRFTIVGVQPSIRDAQPSPGAHTYVMQPSISGFIDDNGGPMVDPQSIRLFIDNTDVTEYAGISGDRFYFTPYYPLSPGWHRVGVYGDDLTGVSFTSEWSFYEIPAYPYGYQYGSLYPWQNLPIYGSGFNFGGFGYNGYPVISLTTPTFGVIGPGGAIPILMIARSGGIAIASIEGAPGSVSLQPVFGAPGYYRGNYIAAFGVNINRAILMAQFYSPNGGLPVTVLQPTGIQIVSGVLRSKQTIVRAPAVAPWVARELPTPVPGHSSGEAPRIAHIPPTIAPLPVWHGARARGASTPSPLPTEFERHSGSGGLQTSPPSPRPEFTQLPVLTPASQSTPRPTPYPTPRPSRPTPKPTPKPHATQKPHSTPTPSSTPSSGSGGGGNKTI